MKTESNPGCWGVIMTILMILIWPCCYLMILIWPCCYYKYMRGKDEPAQLLDDDIIIILDDEDLEENTTRSGEV